jgi:hypothetical protein
MESGAGPGSAWPQRRGHAPATTAPAAITMAKRPRRATTVTKDTVQKRARSGTRGGSILEEEVVGPTADKATQSQIVVGGLLLNADDATAEYSQLAEAEVGEADELI